MKRCILMAVAALLTAASPATAEVVLCGNGQCRSLNAESDYPQIYTTVYGMFKNAITMDVSICDADASYAGCRHNGIKYLGKIGVSETDFNVNALNVIDVRINPSTRNLEIINDYYTYVNGRRVLCSAAKDVLTLSRGNVSLVAGDTKCPYNMQFKSDNSHTFTIGLIDLDRKLIGVRYYIEDNYGAESNPSGYAILEFKNIAAVNYAAANASIMQSYSQQRVAPLPSGYAAAPPSAGMSQHVVADPMSLDYALQSYGRPQQEHFSYKSALPYPWGYYYPPEEERRPTPSKKRLPAAKAGSGNGGGSEAIGRNYTVQPLPKTMIEIGTDGGQLSGGIQDNPVGVFDEQVYNSSVPK